MALNFFQRRKILKNLNFLNVRPVRLHEFIKEESGRVTLIVPKFKKESLRKIFIPRFKSDHFKIKLDEIGTAVWLEADGNKSVQQICDTLVHNLGDNIKPFEEVEARVTKFLTLLYNQRYITFSELLEAEKRKR